MDSYATHMFTDAVRAFQRADGLEDMYARSYERRHRDGLGEDEVAFLQSRTSIYLATVSGTGWPYIQHRGGGTGFLRVLERDRIGFADYRGNRQFISQGNLQDEPRVALFAMDYARRARLKLIGRVQMVAAADDPDLAARLTRPGDPQPERLVTIDVTAFDWNCPKYIVPRFTEAEIEAMLRPRISDLTSEIDRLRARVAELEAAT